MAILPNFVLIWLWHVLWSLESLLLPHGWRGSRPQCPQCWFWSWFGGQSGSHPKSSASYLCTLSKHFISLIPSCIIREKSPCPPRDCCEECLCGALATESGKVYSLSMLTLVPFSSCLRAGSEDTCISVLANSPSPRALAGHFTSLNFCFFLEKMEGRAELSERPLQLSEIQNPRLHFISCLPFCICDPWLLSLQLAQLPVNLFSNFSPPNSAFFFLLSYPYLFFNLTPTP